MKKKKKKQKIQLWLTTLKKKNSVVLMCWL